MRDPVTSVKAREIKSARSALIFVALAALYAYGFGSTHAALEEWWQATFERLVAGEAPTPMQYRILLPWLARRLVSAMGRSGAPATLRQIRFGMELASVFGLLIAVFVVSPSIVVRARVPTARLGGPAAWAAALLVALALPFHFLLLEPSRVFYIYDVPAILFFFLGLAAARAGAWRWFYPLFVLATLNRETSCFLTVVILLAGWGRWPWRRLLAHVAAQTALWLAVKWALWSVFQHNIDLQYGDAAGLFKLTWTDNLAAARHLRTWLLLPAVYGYLWMPLLLVYGRLADPWLRRALLAVPLFHVAMLVPGEILELRIYAEMLPLVVLGLVAASADGGAVDLRQKRPCVTMGAC